MSEIGLLISIRKYERVSMNIFRIVSVILLIQNKFVQDDESCVGRYVLN